jgi:hypothetical protein
MRPSQGKVLGKRVIFLMMTRLEKCIHFYIGCDTNRGKLVGVRQDWLLILEGDRLIECNLQDLGSSLFLHLQLLNEITEDQSRELIKRGIAIGRPNGYTFSNKGFLYLISLHVDLFGLINAGYSKQKSRPV